MSGEVIPEKGQSKSVGTGDGSAELERAIKAHNKELGALTNRIAVLVNALRFYADEKNWQTPSVGFAAQYDREPSPVEKDKGDIARLFLPNDGNEPHAPNT